MFHDQGPAVSVKPNNRVVLIWNIHSLLKCIIFRTPDIIHIREGVERYRWTLSNMFCIYL